MQTIFLSGLFATFLFVGILGCMRLGWRVGRNRLRSLGEDSQAGLGAIDGAVFALMGLLIAFTFTGAASRFDARRTLITEHANAIGTAWLRLDLLSEPDRGKTQDGFRRYVDAQMEIVHNAGDPEAVRTGVHRLAAIQQEIWTTLMQAVHEDKSLPLAQTVLPPVNEMFDLSTTRLMAAQQHPPLAVFIMLAVLVLVSGLLAGYGMAKSERQSKLHVFGFAAILSFSTYLILDIEFPRLGLVRIDSFDQSIIDLRKSMD
jgi:hypothetical protein